MELEAALRALGWELEGPTPALRGWMATCRRGTVSLRVSGETKEGVLESLLRGAKARAQASQALQEQP
jgi:hypothetical protein